MLEGRRPKWSRAAKNRFAAEKKAIYGSEKKPPRCDFFSHRCFDVAGAEMSMGLGGVKEVETKEEDKEVLCS